MLQMDYRFLGIAWPSPVTVDLLLCNMKLLYEDMSTETCSVLGLFFEEQPGPFIKRKRTMICFLSAFIYFN